MHCLHCIWFQHVLRLRRKQEGDWNVQWDPQDESAHVLWGESLKKSFVHSVIRGWASKCCQFLVIISPLSHSRMDSSDLQRYILPDLFVRLLYLCFLSFWIIQGRGPNKKNTLISVHISFSALSAYVRQLCKRFILPADCESSQSKIRYASPALLVLMVFVPAQFWSGADHHLVKYKE